MCWFGCSTVVVSRWQWSGNDSGRRTERSPIATAREIVDSVEQIDDLDRHKCATEAENNSVNCVARPLVSSLNPAHTSARQPVEPTVR